MNKHSWALCICEHTVLYVQCTLFIWEMDGVSVVLFTYVQRVNCCLSSPAAYKCITDQREQLEQTLPLVLGLILGLIIVITISVYHFHLKLTAQQQPQLPRDRSLYKNMWTSPRKRHAPFTFLTGPACLMSRSVSRRQKRVETPSCCNSVVDDMNVRV